MAALKEPMIKNTTIRHGIHKFFVGCTEARVYERNANIIKYFFQEYKNLSLTQYATSIVYKKVLSLLLSAFVVLLSTPGSSTLNCPTAKNLYVKSVLFWGALKYKLYSSEILIQIFGNCLLSKKVMCDMCAPKLRNVVIYCGLRCVAGNSFPIPTSTQNGVSKALPTLCCYRAQHIVHVLS